MIAADATFDQAGTTNAVGALSGAGNIEFGSGGFSAGGAVSSSYAGGMNGAGGSLTIEPYVGAAYVRTRLDGTEEGNALTALQIGRATQSDTVATAGLRVRGPLLDFGKPHWASMPR